MSETHFDVAVIGGGIVGAATSYTLARSGQHVLLLDQYQPGHTNGSSHGDGRIVRFNYPEAIYVEMARLAYEAWPQLETEAGRTLVQRTGLWECAASDNPILDELERNFQHYNIPYERLTAIQSNRRFPQLKLGENSEAIYQPDGMVAYATLAVQTYWQLAAAHGAQTRSDARVIAIEPLADGRIQLRTADATYTAEKIVLAAGGWAKKLLAALGIDLPLRITQEHIAYFLPAKGSPSHRIGHMPNVIDRHPSPPEHIFYALPHTEVAGVKAGFHGTGPEIDPDARPDMDMTRFAPVSQWISQRFPHLSPTPTNALTCLYTITPDEHFILDRHPQHPQIIIGAGFSGHGFKFGPVLGQILAALVQDTTPPLPLETFSLSRF